MTLTQPAIVHEEFTLLARSAGMQTSIMPAHIFVHMQLPVCFLHAVSNAAEQLFVLFPLVHHPTPSRLRTTIQHQPITLTPPHHHHQKEATSHLVGENISPSSVGNRHGAPHDANPTSQRRSSDLVALPRKPKDITRSRTTG